MSDRIDIDPAQMAFWIHGVWMNYQLVTKPENVHAEMVLNNDKGLTIGRATFWGPGKNPLPASKIRPPSPGDDGHIDLNLPIADYEKVQNLFIYKKPVGVWIDVNGRWTLWSGVV